jgi:hypothetical protein
MRCKTRGVFFLIVLLKSNFSKPNTIDHRLEFVAKYLDTIRTYPGREFVHDAPQKASRNRRRCKSQERGALLPSTNRE